MLKSDNWPPEFDRFLQENQQSLAALAWGLRQEWGESQDTLGIDLKPAPHFVCFSRSAIEELNRQVDGRIQEILGILDGCDPEGEVAIVGLGEGQIKLIHFQPDPRPPLCFQQLEGDLTALIQELEGKMRDLSR